jgi:predicted lipoprotein
MASAEHPERRWPLKWLVWAAAAGVVLIVFPPFHVRPLRLGVAPAAIPGAVDVPRVAEKFWVDQLAGPSAKPVEVRTLLMALGGNPQRAAEKYGHRSGIGGSAYFLVEGSGRVTSIDRGGVRLSVDGGSSLPLLLMTGPVFGSALRDATGLLDTADFNSFDFNALGAELNRLAETRAQPALRTGVSVGSNISFVAAGELDDATGDRPVLKLVPIRVTVKP